MFDDPRPVREPRKGIAIARWENEGGAPRRPKRSDDFSQRPTRRTDIPSGAVDDRALTEAVKKPGLQTPSVGADWRAMGQGRQSDSRTAS
jgi:hypothetical protein